MSAPAASPPLERVIRDMEDDVRDLVGFASAFNVFGCSASHIDPRAVHVVAEALEALAARLDQQWNEAFALVVGGKP